jgi:hypothetical protein
MSTTQVDKGQQHTLVVWSVLMTSLACMYNWSRVLWKETFANGSCFVALTVVLRVISRLIVTRKLGADDWIMLVGLVCSFQHAACLVIGNIRS